MGKKNYDQLTLWSEINPYYVIKEPVILLEMFAGIGAQRRGLEIANIKIDNEKSKICEWAYNSYCGYNAIHIKDFTDYTKGLDKEALINKVIGTSTDYNTPLDIKALERKPLEWLKNAYNNIIATHNLVNIMEVKGKDLGELPNKQTSILCYSFPCQDLSLAGHRKGMETSQKEGGTRSGLLWEIERILLEREREKLELPTILLMENVPQVHSEKDKKHFIAWQKQLERLGYKSYWEDLNGCDYQIPQNRIRTFMVSIKGNYVYDFPYKIPLKYRLKDLLEMEVDEKYYLDDKTLERISAWNSHEKPLDNAIDVERERERVMPTITARGAGEEHAGMKLIKVIPNKINVVGNYGNGHHAKDIVDSEGLSSTIATGNHGLGQTILIKNATSKGYLEANVGDGVDISSRMHYHRGTVQKGKSQTLTTQGGESVGVITKNDESD